MSDIKKIQNNWSVIKKDLDTLRKIFKKKYLFDEYDSISRAIASINYHLKYTIKVSCVRNELNYSRDSLEVENKHSTFELRGGKKAKDPIKKLFQEHCDNLDF